MEDPVRISIELARLFGVDEYGQARWRVVWSNDQLEKRLGTFRDYWRDVFIRQVTEVREVPKYPMNKDRWVLEKLVWAPNPELVQSDKPHYEMIYCFERNGKYLIPNLRACLLIIYTLQLGSVKQACERMGEEEVELAREMGEFFEELDDADPYVAGQLRDGEGISVPSTYERANEPTVTSSDEKGK